MPRALTTYDAVLAIHSVLRWLVLALGAAAVAGGLAGAARDRPAPRKRLGSAFVGALDLQLLAGLALYVFLSPVARAGIGYWTFLHPALGVAAVALAHVANVRGRRAADAAGLRGAAALLGLALVAAALAVPWPGLAQGRPLWP